MPFKTTFGKFFERRLRKVQKSETHPPSTSRERSEGGKKKMPTIFKYSGKEAKEVYVAGKYRATQHLESNILLTSKKNSFTVWTPFTKTQLSI